MRAKCNGEIRNYEVNFLNLEIIKQEFLIDWMNKKLKGNKEKFQVYKKYSLNGNSIDKIIKKNPDQEPKLLQSLDIGVFKVIFMFNQTVKNVEQEYNDVDKD